MKLPVAPPPSSFPAFPVSWYYFGDVAGMKNGVMAREIFGRRVVVFRAADGRLAAMDARCSHMGTDLGRGCVVGDGLQCPYHHWVYGADGHCSRIPASETIPSFAAQRTFPVEQRHGLIFVFNHSQPLFPLPFFDGLDPARTICSRLQSTVLQCPWYLIGANAFDLQHFRAAHDRRLLGDPEVATPLPFARTARARFEVCGNSVQDRLTRIVGGRVVELQITDYCGSMLLATATFRRTRSYGLVMIEPLSDGRVQVRVMAFLPRGSNPLTRFLLDRASVFLRWKAICRFLESDAVRLSGAWYHPGRFIDADRHLVEYFRWLSVVSHGRPGNDPNPQDDPDMADAVTGAVLPSTNTP